jgi:hypothetical protein
VRSEGNPPKKQRLDKDSHAFRRARRPGIRQMLSKFAARKKLIWTRVPAPNCAPMVQKGARAVLRKSLNLMASESKPSMVHNVQVVDQVETKESIATAANGLILAVSLDTPQPAHHSNPVA